jgi:hypothetical protein
MILLVAGRHFRRPPMDRKPTMTRIRKLILAASLVAAAATIGTAPAYADACSSQQGFRRLINGVWTKWVWVKVKVGRHEMWRMVECGPGW